MQDGDAMSPSIQFRVDQLPPIKRGSESMWQKQIERIKPLRAAAAEHPQAPATLDDDVSLDVVVYARPMDGDLDGFVAGICDGLQPPHANFRPWLQAADWQELPEAARPDNALGFVDDRAISTITARRLAPTERIGYEVSITW